jgi:hypothetical protein
LRNLVQLNDLGGAADGLVLVLGLAAVRGRGLGLGGLGLALGLEAQAELHGRVHEGLDAS